MKRFLIGSVFCVIALCHGAPESADPAEAVQTRIRQIESAVSEICSRADRGRLTEPARVRMPADENGLPAVDLTFSLDTLDRDLDAALEAISLLERRLLAVRPQTQMPPVDPPAGRPLSVEERLRRAETGLPTISPGVRPPAFDMFGDYEGSLRDRQAQRDARDEADMERVAGERRQAEAHQSARKEAVQRVQDQNRQWQEELDNQAIRHAEAEEQWKREHGAGALVRNTLRTLVGGAVASFGGGLASSMGAGLADRIVRDRYPEFKPRGEYDREARK